MFLASPVHTVPTPSGARCRRRLVLRQALIHQVRHQSSEAGSLLDDKAAATQQVCPAHVCSSLLAGLHFMSSSDMPSTYGMPLGVKTGRQRGRDSWQSWPEAPAAMQS
jgi:hypothetical protein